MSDSVGKIHGRFYLTLINPSSHKTSLFIMLIATGIASIIANLDDSKLLYRVPLSLLAVYLATWIDYRLLKNLEVTNLSKIYHVGAFAMIFYLLTIMLGVLANNIFMHTTERYILAGMMLIIGFRISIFRSVFGARLKAFFVAPIMPILFFLASEEITSLFDIQGLVFGSIFLSIAIIWSILADKAGRPWVESTFRLLQAYLLAWTENDARAMEEMMSNKAEYANVRTMSLLFRDVNTAIILPEVHPGPFNPVGGSKLPSMIHDFYYKQGINAMVMHSISDHALNLPSKEEVMNYLKGLSNYDIIANHYTCTEPIICTINKARVTGLAYGDNAILMLSLSPHGMEDIDEGVKHAIEPYAKRLSMNPFLIDTHNSLGEHLNNEDRADMIEACKMVLDRLNKAKQYNFMIGSANSREIQFEIKQDIGDGGLGVIATKINDKIYTLAWADANNIVKGLREHIINTLAEHGINMLEICTSDTHQTSGRARNRQGYYTLGTISNWDYLSNAFIVLSRLAISRLKPSDVTVTLSNARVRVMGLDQFDDYSKALDKSLNLTKITLALTLIVYITMLLV